MYKTVRIHIRYAFDLMKYLHERMYFNFLNKALEENHSYLNRDIVVKILIIRTRSNITLSFHLRLHL